MVSHSLTALNSLGSPSLCTPRPVMTRTSLRPACTIQARLRTQLKHRHSTEAPTALQASGRRKCTPDIAPRRETHLAGKKRDGHCSARLGRGRDDACAQAHVLYFAASNRLSAAHNTNNWRNWYRQFPFLHQLYFCESICHWSTREGCLESAVCEHFSSGRG